MKNSNSVKYVVLSSPFNQYANADARVLIEGGSVEKGKDYLYSYFVKTLSEIRALGIVPVVFSLPPKSGYNLGQCLLKAQFYRERIEKCDFDFAVAEQKQRDVIEVLKKVDVLDNVIWLSDYICPGSHCKASNAGVLIYRDEGHLARESSRLVGRGMNFYKLLIDSK